MAARLVVSAEPGRGASPAGLPDFRLLGAVEVVVGGRLVGLGGLRQRALLALLVLRANEVVSRDVLIEGLWGERAPADGAHSLVVCVSRLRKALRAGGVEGVLRTEAGGYVLGVDPERTDVGRFERGLGEGGRVFARGAWGEAARVLREALGEWRGEPLSDVVFEPFAGVEVRRLEELRLTALERRIEADLALGGGAELVGELEALVRRYPLNERLCGQLMLALYRSGRQVEALEVYRAARGALVDGLGIEPGADLRRLEQAILRHDRDLEPPEAPSAEEAPPAGAPAAPSGRRRKTVSVLVARVVPAAQGGQDDPESLHLVVGRYLAAMRWAIGRHGGTIERFVGETVLGVFGVPIAHEDDALRAVRAAVDMRTALRSLAKALAGEQAATLELGVGVSTGRVLTDTEEPLVTGKTVSVAVGLAEIAQPGEILLGPETARLLGQAVDAEPLGPASASGLVEPVEAYRFRRLRPVEKRPGSIFVGRERELALLREAFTRVREERELHLFTLLGPAGIGKSRLTAEFAGGLEARVVHGRCLSYGEGITYWPVTEVLKQLDLRPAQESAAAAIASLLGESEQATDPDQIAWAFRKTLETAAARQPLVCVLDDLHWAEPALLDLVEQVADYSRDAPMLLVCLARPELLDHRPGWAGGKLNASTLLLEPLTVEESGLLLDRLGGAEPELQQRILAAAEGNPLFLEEMHALARTSGDGKLEVPPSIQALLATRLDQLDPAERTLLEHASVEGTHFHQGALEAAQPGEPGIEARLHALVRRDLIRPAEPQLPGQDAYRFRHQLIRDAAYDTLPKAHRAELHHQFAGWIADQNPDLVELDEIIGYHLEQTCRYQHELTQPTPPELAAEARTRLSAAGRRACLREDYVAAASLLERAALLDPDLLDIPLELDLQQAMFNSRPLPGALARVEQTIARAAAAGDRTGELCLRLKRGIFRWSVQPEGAAEELEELIEQTLHVFEAGGDDAALHLCWLAAAHVAHSRSLYDDMAAAADRSLEHARRAGLAQRYAPTLYRAHLGRVWGSSTASEWIAWLDEQEAAGRRFRFTRMGRARALAMLGRIDEARAVYEDAIAEYADRLSGQETDATITAARLELLAGNTQAAAELWEQHCRQLEQLGERAVLSTMVASLARVQYMLGWLDQAEANARRAARLGASGDADTQAGWRQVEAKLLACRGKHTEAERLAREAVAIAGRTQALELQAEAYFDLGEVLALAGNIRAAREALEQAAARYERKEHLVGLQRTQARLAELGTVRA